MKKKGGYIRSSGLFILSLVVVNLLIILASLRYYFVEKNSFIEQKVSQLKAISDSKINQINDWRNERYSDARYLSLSAQINENFNYMSDHPGDKKVRQMLFGHLYGMFLNDKYESMVVVDSSGKIVLSIPEADSLVQPYMKDFRINGNQEITVSDFFICGNRGPAMQIIIPKFDKSGPESTIIGWILLNINLRKEFLPRLKTLPVLDESIEICIQLKDDKGMTLLNSGIRDNQDNKDCTIQTGNIHVPSTNLFLQVRMDKSEAFAGMKKMRMGILAFTLLMVVAFSSAISFFRVRQRHEMDLLETDKRIIQERFDMLSKFANDAIIVYTTDMIILQVNDMALELYGYTREEFLGLNAEILRPPETRHEIRAILETTLNEGGYRFETIHIMKDGTRFPVEVSIRFMEYLGNSCFQSVVRDITQRKKFEKAIIASEERLRLITNTMPQIVWTATPEGGFDYVNSRFEFLTGFQFMKETSISGFIHPDDHLRVLEFWQAAIKAKTEQQIRFRLRMKEGHYKWFLCIAIPLCDESGRLLKWYGSATDIDELENQVAQRTAELSDLYNNAPCGYHSVNPNGYFTQINNTALSWLGYHRDELIGKLTFADLLTPGSRMILEAEFREFIKTGHVENMEFEMLRKDGSILPVLLSASTVKDAQGNVTMFRSTITDHTQRKKFENEILKLNTVLQEHGYHLEYANKELEAFIFSVSHDLRAPLRAINGFSRILMDEYSTRLDDEARKLLERVCSNAERMRQLIDDLLRLSRTGRQELSYTRIDMEALFNSMIEETRQHYPERDISVNIKTLPVIEADLALIKQVISNLLSNAVKFSAKREVSVIEVGAINGSEDPSIYIKDNGTGFDMKYSNELFGVFRRLDNASDYEGTGVGLALAKRIIDKHGGKIWAKSEPEKGATFFFTIPKNKEIQL